MEYDVGEINRRVILWHIYLGNLLLSSEKDTERGCSAQEPVWKEVGRMGAESSLLPLSWRILDLYMHIKFTECSVCDKFKTNFDDWTWFCSFHYCRLAHNGKKTHRAFGTKIKRRQPYSDFKQCPQSISDA